MSDTPANTRRRKLFVHIGMHKTGTTSIQKYCQANIGLLKNSGLIYPQSGIAGYHHLFSVFDSAASDQVRRSLLNGMSDAQIKWINECYPNSLNSTKKEIEGSAHDVLISSEHFIFLTSSCISRLSEFFSDFDIIPILVFRNFAAFANSFYHTYLTTFRKPLRLSEIDIISSFRLDFSSLIPAWRQGTREKVLAIDYDLLASSNKGLVGEFFEIIGYPQEKAKLASRENISLPPYALYILHELQNSGASAGQIAQFSKAIGDFHAAEPQSLLDEVTELKFLKFFETQLNFMRQSSSDCTLLESNKHRNHHPIISAHITSLFSAVMAMIRAIDKRKSLSGNNTS